MAGEPPPGYSSGGMVTKIAAARIAMSAGCRMVIAKGKRMALRHGFGTAGTKLIALAGVPFGTPGTTNVLHVVRLVGDELERHKKQG